MTAAGSPAARRGWAVAVQLETGRGSSSCRRESAADGTPFQASWDSGSTFETVIGEGKVIQGWDEGIPGMKVGGRRKLVIPAEMAYGAEDTGDGRPHGDLVFIIDVYAIK